ncbi:Similar to Trhr: Thyrotropin-releasing hormone receptor (Mus musculus) [Cotesia congregata]|uniref:Similar to Trhr: Thyrotropin-releasing hormone receptor (Mus musculus) n=1 Tax=Cotesia congregata TaxID=51543 RepID=A0A8J2EKK0_COTCN|nr:Similar to Trhr: Thyrotropin-releasing hormone receptor (Mus musculus) [Cotesia congregata]
MTLFALILQMDQSILKIGPMIWVSQYHEMRMNTTVNSEEEKSEAVITVCLMQADSLLTMTFFLLLIIIFFVIPLFILLLLYLIIIRQLINDRSASTAENYHARARKQVVLMLLAVVFSFFICLAPFKILTFYIVLAPNESVEAIDHDTFYNILYFSRIMFYLNSAVNPILYNLMSSRFSAPELTEALSEVLPLEQDCRVELLPVRIFFLRFTYFLLLSLVFKINLSYVFLKSHVFRNSPILTMTVYSMEKDDDGSELPACSTSVKSIWPMIFFLTTIIIFFIIPLVILVVLYTVIARHLMRNPAITRGPANNLLKYRKQVVLMLGTVVISFFICLLPFRAFTLWVIVSPLTAIINLGVDGYFILLYISRVMLYLNSAINPILYNLMSTKFREGFLRLCGLSRKQSKDIPTSGRTGTTTSSNHSDFWRRQSNSSKSCSVKVSSASTDNNKPFMRL